MKISTANLRAVSNALFDHLERNGIVEVELDKDFYWAIQTEDLYSPYEQPKDLTLGQLSSDLADLDAIRTGRSQPTSHSLVWLSAVLRWLGDRTLA